MHKIFVYGSLLSGMGNHRLLEGSNRLGISRSPKGFGLIDLGYFPGAVKLDDTDKTIIGEVYEVDDITFARIDRLEGYRPDSPESGLYNRQEINTDFGKAIVYIFNSKYGRAASMVENGDWRTYYSRKTTIIHKDL